MHEQFLAAFDMPTPAAPTKLLKLTLIGLVVLLLVGAGAVVVFLLARALL